MATAAQISANRENALHSTGPRTDRGKAAVAQNRVTHGLTGRHIVLPGEDAAEYDLLLADFTAEYQPAGPTELFLVHQLAESQWKLQRIACMEAQIFTRHLESGGTPDASAAWEKDCAGDNSLSKLSRYEGIARRAWYKAAAQLSALHAPRRAADANRIADDRLEAPVPAGPPAAPPPTAKNDPPIAKNDNDNSKPISPSASPSRLNFWDPEGSPLDRELVARLARTPQKTEFPVWARWPRVTNQR